MKVKYIELYNEFVKKIENKELKIGDKLLPEKELMKKYNLSRDTVRKALNLLVQEGYIEKSRGKLAEVIEKKQFNFMISKIVSFHELHSNINYSTSIENFEIENGDKKIMKKLKLNSIDEYFKIIRTRKIDGEKIIIDKDYLPRKYVNNISLRDIQVSLYKYLEDILKLEIDYCYKEITVEEINDEDSELLDIKNFDMVVVVRSFTYLKGDILFQYTESRHRPDKFKFVDYAYRNK